MEKYEIYEKVTQMLDENGYERTKEFNEALIAVIEYSEHDNAFSRLGVSEKALRVKCDLIAQKITLNEVLERQMENLRTCTHEVLF